MVNNIVVVGASAAGLTAVESLRNKGYEGRLTLVGDEQHVPYDRPPLSKGLLAGEMSTDQTLLRSAEALSAIDVELRFGSRATGLDQEARTISLASGENLLFDAAVIATGIRPRRLPWGNDVAGVHVLRTLDDSLALRSSLVSGSPRVAVIGAGYLGSEIAATARGLGLEVTLIDTNPVPLYHQVGPVVGEYAASFHRDRGVSLVMRRHVTGMQQTQGRVTGVQLADGRTIPADVVVVAIGSVPNTEWLASSGLDIGDGLLVDEFCKAAPGIYAAGDVANFPHALHGGRVRIELRTNAAQMAMAAAGNLLDGDTRPFAQVPFGWSDQYDAKIQTFGWCASDASVEVVHGSFEDGSFSAVYRKSGRIVGCVGWNTIKGLREYRPLIGKQERVAVSA
jgi:NADPH-dependent 2,4-dienoyl-CoA reductase/sulfur reductase-like enzyme